MSDIICRFFIGNDPTPTDETNNNCGIDHENCDDPTHPCDIHYDKNVVMNR